MGVIKYISDIVYTPVIDRKNLVVLFDLQIEVIKQICLHISEQSMQVLFVVVQDDDIVAVAVVVLNHFHLLNPMIKVCQV